MKRTKTLAFSIIVAFCLFFINNSSAQTSKNQNHTASDQQLLKGFNEQAVINELKAKGIPETEFPGILRLRKTNYLLKIKGLKQKSVLPGNPPQTGPCINSGFEDTTFTNWSAATGLCSFLPTTWTSGLVSNGLNALSSDPLSRHTILTNTTGFDPNAINSGTGLPEIPLTAPGGGGVSVRLGNSNIGAETEKLDYQITVTPLNTSFTYQYAVVLEFLSSHDSATQPRFDIRILDQFGNQIVGNCGIYAVEGLGASTDTTFHWFNPNSISFTGGWYKKWTTVGIDLTPYIGSTVTIEFQTSDCTATGHFGYAYIDASCSQLQANVAFCPSDTVLMLTAPGGYNGYQWYDNNNLAIPSNLGGTNDTLWIHNPVMGQVYTVSMLSAAGCGTSLSATLQYTNISIANHSSNISCFGLSDGMAYVTTTGANPPFTYVWHDITTGGNVVGTNNDSLINAPPGLYYVSVSSNGGCAGNSDTINIQQPTQLPDTLATSIVYICPNDTLTILIAPPGSTSYQWFDQTNLPISSILGGKNDSLWVHNPIVGQVYYCSLDCPHWFADTIKLKNNLNVLDYPTNISCPGLSDGMIYVTTPGTLPPMTYVWTNGSGTIVGSNNDTLFSLPFGYYSVNITSFGGCVGHIDSIQLTQPITDTLAPAMVLICPNDTLVLMVAPSGSSAYQWYDQANNPISSNLGGINDSIWIHNPIVGQVYYCSLECPHWFADSIKLKNSLNILDYPTNISCFGVSDGMIYVTTPGTSPPITYVWTNSSGGIIGSNNDTLSNLPPGYYSLNITSAGGCVGHVDSIQLTQPTALPDTLAAAMVFVCPNDTTATLTATAGALSYQWFDQSNQPISLALGGKNSTIQIHNPVAGQTYYCAIDCPHWCSVTLQSNNIQVNQSPVTNVTCFGFNNGSASVSTSGPAPGPYFYSWINATTGAIVNSSSSYNNAYAGTYYVNVHTYGGCSKTDTIVITQPPNPTDSTKLTTTFCMEDKDIVLRLPAGLGYYQWYAGTDTSATAMVLSTNDTLLISDPVVGSVYTIVINPGGATCPYTISYNLQYSPPPNLPSYIITANTFTPDGDNINDKFDVSIDPLTHNTFAYVKDFHIEIYNRWGKKVFESNDVHAQWDGKINGSSADEGVYYWMASYTSLCTPGGEPHESTGFVELFKKK